MLWACLLLTDKSNHKLEGSTTGPCARVVIFTLFKHFRKIWKSSFLKPKIWVDNKII